jgi:hypothetical protein
VCRRAGRRFDDGGVSSDTCGQHRRLSGELISQNCIKEEIAVAKKTESGSQSGGVNISGKDVKVSGDIVGRDMHKTVTTTTTGMTAAEFAAVFDKIYTRINNLPTESRAEAREAVDAIKAEAEKEALKGEPINESSVKFPAQSLLKMAPDILEVIATTFANPAAGVATVIRKILEKAKGQAAA